LDKEGGRQTTNINTATLSVFKSWPVAEQAFVPARNPPMILVRDATASCAAAFLKTLS